MPFSLQLLPSTRPPSPYEYDDSCDDELSNLHPLNSQQQYLLPPLLGASGTSSALSSATNSPLPSRSSSPVPQPAYTSTSDDEPSSPFLTSGRSSSRHRRWWLRRRKRDATLRGWKRTMQRIVRHPFFPTQPLTILLSLLLLTTFALLLTLSLIYILNPDKYALPWRQYCYETPQFPPPPGSNSHYNFTSLPPAGVYLGVFSMDAAVERRMLIRTSWASHRTSRGTDGSTDRTIVRFVLGRPRKEWERRIKLEMETYNDIVILPIAENMNNGKSHAYFTWANDHAFVPPPPFVQIPGGPTTSNPDDSPEQDSQLSSTSNQPSSSARRDEPPSAMLDASPLAAQPPDNPGSISPAPSRLAPHDPKPRISSPHLHRTVKRASSHRLGYSSASSLEAKRPWVQPDFVLKADDDSFVMLSELEGRLRVELADATVAARLEGRAEEERDPLVFWGYLVKNRFMAGELYGMSRALVKYVATTASLKGMTRGAEDKQTAKWIRLHPQADRVRWRSEHCWIYDHPRAGTVYSHGFLFPSEWKRVKEQVQRWAARRTHPTTGLPADTLPTEENDASSSISGKSQSETSSSSPKSESSGYVQSSTSLADPHDHPWKSPTWHLGAPDPSIPPPPISPSLSHSSVSRFGIRYTPPVRFNNLTAMMEVETLVEGSLMSKLRRDESSPGSSIWEELRWDDVQRAWGERESWKSKYMTSDSEAGTDDEHDEHERGALGGTVCVHFIKKNEWYMETVLAFLGGSSGLGQNTITPPDSAPRI